MWLVSSASVKALDTKVVINNEFTLTASDFVYKDKKGVEKSRVTIGKTELKYGTDFEVENIEYKVGVKKGTAKVTIKGINEYSGTKVINVKYEVK